MPEASPPSPSLVIDLPTGRQTVRLRQQPLTIGRAPDNVLPVKDPDLSRRHCVIEADGDGWCVRDLGSSNGTRVNGRRIARHQLAPGDHIRIGGVAIQVLDPAADPSSNGAGDAVHDPPPASGRAERPASAAGSRRRASAAAGAPGGTPIDPLTDGADDVALSMPGIDEPLDPVALAADPTVDPGRGFDPLDAAYIPPEDRLPAAFSPAEAFGGDAETFERMLRSMIEATPSIGFGEDDLALVDAAGATVHAADDSGHRTGDRFAALRAFRLMLYACFRSRATDLHLEDRGDDDGLLRLRVDGLMIPPIEVDRGLVRRVLGIVRVLCRHDTSRRAAVLDGHFSVTIRERRVDYRASFTPAMRGQKLVVRVLDASAAPSRLADLDLVPWMADKLRRAVNRDAGLVLAAGPTGSGKTTSLYALMREIDRDHRNVITIEDPVEYSVTGVTQIPIDAEQGHTFATILRSVLRQDPDVILVGEIRDLETARTVMQSSMTGHLVFSTVHARDTVGSVFRLLDLGVEPYLVANALSLILAQRLVRQLCPHCCRPVRPTPAQSMRMGSAAQGLDRIQAPGGCRRCLGTGYHGRRAVIELLEVGDAMRDIILGTPSIQKMRHAAGLELFTSLDSAGWQMVAEGRTAVEEIDRIAD